MRRRTSAAIGSACTTNSVINTGDEPLKHFTVYSPPQHAPGTVHPTKTEAAAAEKNELPI